MTNDDLITKLDKLAAESYGFDSGDLQKKRAEALRRYLCEPRGDEVEGRSSVVSTDLRDVVEWIVPQWLKITMSGDKVVKFEPTGPEDEKQAELETDYVNYVILQRNDALTFLSTWARDALISMNGYAKAYWTEKDDVRTERYKGLTEDALAMLLQDSEVEITAASPYQMAMAQGMATLYDVEVRRVYKCGHVKVENVPPEEIGIHKSVRGLDLQEAPYIRHRTKKSRTELALMGYDVALLPDDEGVDNDEVVEARDRWEEDSGDSEDDTVWLTEEYARIDFDGDGTSELRRIVRVGSRVLVNEEWDLVPFACITPIVFPHRHIGIGYNDLVEQHAKIKTTLMRQALDNLYLSNNARIAADTDRVNIDDLLVARPGGVIRTKGSPGDVMMPVTVPNVFPVAMQGIEWVDAWRENSTGVSAYYQGMNADALNKTAQGINQIMSASQQRVEAVLRSFCNGFRDLCYIVHALTLKNNTAPEKLKLNNQWVTVNPREWVKRTNMTVTVGLGTGSKDVRVQQLGMLWQMQMQGGQLGIAKPQNLYNTGAKIAEELGYRNADDFWTNPANTPPQPPPPPDPKVLELQQKGQIEMAKLQQEAQNAEAERQLKLYIAQLQSQTQEVIAQMKAYIDEQSQLVNAKANETRAEIDRVKLQLDVLDKMQGQKEPTINVNGEDIKQAHTQTAEVMSQGLSQLAQAVSALQESLNRPKQVVRDPSGRVVGVQ